MAKGRPKVTDGWKRYGRGVWRRLYPSGNRGTLNRGRTRFYTAIHVTVLPTGNVPAETTIRDLGAAKRWVDDMEDQQNG